MEPSRYFAERPLPATPFLPGTGMPRPTDVIVDEAPAGAALADDWPASPAFLYGVDLFNAGFSWEAHEQWEALWRLAPRQSAEHALLQGLIQAAAAVLKARITQTGGAIRLALSATQYLSAADAGVAPELLGFSPAAFAAELLRWAHDLAEARTPAELKLHLARPRAG